MERNNVELPIETDAVSLDDDFRSNAEVSDKDSTPIPSILLPPSIGLVIWRIFLKNWCVIFSNSF